MTDEESARVFDAFGPLVPDQNEIDRARANLELDEYGMELVRQTDFVDQLRRVASPTLVCVGELDPVTPVAASQEIVAALPGRIAQLEVIEGAGHWAWKDAPDRYLRIVRTFIQTISGEALTG